MMSLEQRFAQETTEMTPQNCGLNCRVVLFTSTDTNDPCHVKDENFTVTDFAGLRRANNRIYADIDNVVRHDNLNFYLRQKIHHILRAAIQLGMAFLTAKTFHLGDRHAGNADFSQCFADIVQLEGFNNRINLFMLFLEKVACLLIC